MQGRKITDADAVYRPSGSCSGGPAPRHRCCSTGSPVGAGAGGARVRTVPWAGTREWRAARCWSPGSAHHECLAHLVLGYRLCAPRNNAGRGSWIQTWGFLGWFPTGPVVADELCACEGEEGAADQEG